MNKAASKKAGKATKKSGEDGDDDEDDGDQADEVDDWDKVEEEDNWDPDFDEFDIPKSKVKKATGGAGKKAGKEEDDFSFEDDEFKDMDLFNDSVDEEDDDF